MKAIIMAGGQGKRLRPLTCTMPKPLVPLLNKPVMDYGIELLRQHGVTDITATLWYLPNMIMKRYGDGRFMGVRMTYSVETVPLGTAGSVRKAAGKADDRYLILSGDALTDLDITAALREHEANQAKVTIVLKRVDAPTEYGVALMDKDGKIRQFLEKPMLSEVFSDLANTGIYILEPEIIERIPEDTEFDFSKDLFPLLLKENIPIFGHVTEKYWCDIGDLEQYISAQKDMLDGKCDFCTIAEKRNGIFVEPGAKLSERCVIMPPCYIGSNAEIADGAILADHSVIGTSVRIGRSSSAKRSILMEDVLVRENVEIRGAILCEGAHVNSGASLFAHAAVGAGSNIGKNCSVASGVSIWPEKNLEDDSQCCENLIWDEGKKKPESTMALRGFADFDITPEYAARVGAAFAATMRIPAEIAIVTDGSQQAVMLKYAVISGVISQGVDLYDMGLCGYSAFENGIRTLNLAGGIYIRHSGAEPHAAEIILCDKSGAEITGGAFRSFKQELGLGARLPVTGSRLGILQRVSSIEKVYEANLARTARKTNPSGGRGSVIIGGSGEVYDSVARILLPCGYDVRYSSEKKKSVLMSAVAHERADVGFLIDDENNTLESVIFEDEEVNANKLAAILMLLALREGRMKAFFAPVSLPEEYVKYLEANGAKVKRAPKERAKWMRAALSEEGYLPELFEPEACIIRIAHCAVNGELKELLNGLPYVATEEKSVGCSWKDMGRILRNIVDTEQYERIELMDGVKVKDDKGWILVSPEKDLNACRVIAGSFDSEYSKELTDLYIEKIRGMTEENGKS